MDDVEFSESSEDEAAEVTSPTVSWTRSIVDDRINRALYKSQARAQADSVDSSRVATKEGLGQKDSVLAESLTLTSPGSGACSADSGRTSNSSVEAALEARLKKVESAEKVFRAKVAAYEKRRVEVKESWKEWELRVETNMKDYKAAVDQRLAEAEELNEKRESDSRERKERLDRWAASLLKEAESQKKQKAALDLREHELREVAPPVTFQGSGSPVEALIFDETEGVKMEKARNTLVERTAILESQARACKERLQKEAELLAEKKADLEAREANLFQLARNVDALLRKQSIQVTEDMDALSSWFQHNDREEAQGRTSAEPKPGPVAGDTGSPDQERRKLCIAGLSWEVGEADTTVDQVLARPGYPIKGKKVQPKKVNARPGKVFVSGLPGAVSAEEVKAYFAQFGNVLEINTPIDKTTNRRKAYCFVTFEQEQVAHELIKSAKQTIGGKEVDVKRVRPAHKAWCPGSGRGGGTYGFGYPTYGAGVYDGGAFRSDYPTYRAGGYDYYGGGYIRF